MEQRSVPLSIRRRGGDGWPSNQPSTAPPRPLHQTSRPAPSRPVGTASASGGRSGAARSRGEGAPPLVSLSPMSLRYREDPCFFCCHVNDISADLFAMIYRNLRPRGEGASSPHRWSLYRFLTRSVMVRIPQLTYMWECIPSRKGHPPPGC